MFISGQKEEISLPLENGVEPLKSYSFLSKRDDNVVSSMASDLPELPQNPVAFTDVDVVPGHEEDQLEQTISDLEGEILDLKLKQKSLDDKRREALNKILDIRGCIRVFCRVKPFLSTDRRRIRQPISVESDEKIVVRSAGSKKEFVFDKVFPQEANQVRDSLLNETPVEEVFVEVEPILRSALDGHNVCILAYGQTGTGKTYTMDGTNDSPGIVPRALEQLFRHAALDCTATFTFSISMLEVYLGHLRDLLAPKLSNRSHSVSRCNLNIQTDAKGSVEIEGLTEIPISNVTKASWWYTKGRRVRSTSWTHVNQASSRSHCLTKITIYKHGNVLGGKTEVSKLWMVDLGGSERLLKTGAIGQTLDEGRAINLSLSALGDVIAALRRKRGHVPYRNSKLTQILKDSLGDGSKVMMLIHVSPYEDDVGETTCSFTFAKRAKAVDSNRELTEGLKKQKEMRISELEEDMREAEAECQKIRNQIQKVEFLLSENKKLFATTHEMLEDEGKMIPTSPNEYNSKEVTVIPRASEKAERKMVPHFTRRFMSSTVASRQRQTSAEKENYSKARSSRSGTRSSIQISGSQSFSYSDPRFKAFLKVSNKKPRFGESNNSLSEIISKSNGLDSKSGATPRGMMVVSSSEMNLKVTLGRHRRRMSDLV